MIKVDNKTYKSRRIALSSFLQAMCACEGSEGERMSYAYAMLLAGYNEIDTYRSTAKR